MSASQLIRRAWQSIASPVIRLQPNFPWKLGKSVKTYVIALAYYFVGTFVSAFGLLYGVLLLSKWYPEIPQTLLVTYYQPFIVTVAIISFLTGFGLEVRYLAKAVGKDGFSFTKLCGLNLNSLGGSAWAAIWRGILTYGVMMAADPLIKLIPMPPAHDPAAQFLSELSGWPLHVMALLVVTGVIFEEIVFRGFLFNMVRSSLWKPGAASNRKADIIAIVVSASAFALAHFNPSGFLSYFVLGAILAESYRRSGSLYVPLIAHFLNNLTAVVILFSTMH